MFFEMVWSPCFHMTSFLQSIFLKMGTDFFVFLPLTLTSKVTRPMDLSEIGVFV